MRRGAYLSRAPRRTHENLTVRARPARTFGGLLTFTALLLLCCGMYLVARPLIDPVASHDAGLLVGAFTIALACVLLFYLAKAAMPRRRTQDQSRQERTTQAEEAAFAKGLVIEPMPVRRTRLRV